MSRNIIKDLDKYTEKGGSIKLKKEISELNSWYELEEILHEAHEQSGCNSDDKEKCSSEAQKKWGELTDRGRGFGCFISEVENTIKKLGGQLYKDRNDNDNNRERERERERAKLLGMSKEHYQ